VGFSDGGSEDEFVEFGLVRDYFLSGIGWEGNDEVVITNVTASVGMANSARNLDIEFYLP